jgi:hypothetical protein
LSRTTAPPLPAWPGETAPPRTAPPPRAAAEELVTRPGGGFQVRSTERHTFSPPTGTVNFVRVHGDIPRSRPLLVSAKLAHAQIPSGRSVVYAGTARFDSGEMAWWSNCSGAYQPIASFRAQAGLPENKCVPMSRAIIILGYREFKNFLLDEICRTLCALLVISCLRSPLRQYARAGSAIGRFFKAPPG